MNPGKAEVYYDGSCRMCTAFVGAVEKTEKGSRFALKDASAGALPEGVSKEAAMREIHVIEGGKTYKNADAILKMLEAYPLWRPVVWLGRLPGIRSLLRFGYGVIAQHRHRL